MNAADRSDTPRMMPANIEILIAKSGDARLPCVADRLYALPQSVQREIGILVAARLRMGGLAEHDLTATNFGIIDSVLRVAEVAGGSALSDVPCARTCRRNTCVAAMFDPGDAA